MAERGGSGNFYSRWRRRRRLVRESKHLLKESRRILRRYSHRIKDEVAAEVRKAMAVLSESLQAKDFAAVRDRLDKLDTLVDRHLAFGRKSAIREYAESIGVAVLVALLLRAFVVEAFKIPSGSMIPTLAVGDHLFVNKFLYGMRIPWTHFKFLEVRKPHRGEVIVFIPPHDESKDFIKRIVAIEGDTISVVENRVLINGKPIKRTALPGPCVYADGEEGASHWEPRPCRAFLEENDGIKYRVIQDLERTPSEPPRTDLKPTKVPPGHVFVMGDNRDNSLDSRFWGTVPDENIKGKAMIIWWSNGVPDGIRWGRFFQLVHGGPRLDRPVQP